MQAMLDPAQHRCVKRNFYRVHCQFVSGNDRAAYDYFMFTYVPFPPRTRSDHQTASSRLSGRTAAANPPLVEWRAPELRTVRSATKPASNPRPSH